MAESTVVSKLKEELHVREKEVHAKATTVAQMTEAFHAKECELSAMRQSIRNLEEGGSSANRNAAGAPAQRSDDEAS